MAWLEEYFIFIWERDNKAMALFLSCRTCRGKGKSVGPSLCQLSLSLTGKRAFRQVEHRAFDLLLSFLCGGGLCLLFLYKIFCRYFPFYFWVLFWENIRCFRAQR